MSSTTRHARNSVRLRNRLIAISSLAVLVPALLLPVPAANAAEAGSPQAGVEKLGAQEVAAISSSLGLTAAQVHERFDGQNQFSAAMEKIEKADPAYATGKWESSNGSKAWIQFTTVPSAASQQIIKALPYRVEIRTGAKANAAQIQETIQTTQQSLLKVPGVVNAATWYDQKAQSIHAEYKSTAPDSTTAALSQTQHSKAGLSAEGAGLPVAIVANSALEVNPQVARGGMSFTGCTSGFAATKGTLRGVLTAGHCGNSGLYLANSGATTFNSEHQGGYGDFQFNTTADSLSGSINVSFGGDLMAINGELIAANGTTACNYGATRQGWSCAVVQNNSICSGALCRLVQTDRAMTQPGDSGGPWFAGNKALGIHFGFVNNKSTYSRIGNAEAILGVILKHT